MRALGHGILKLRNFSASFFFGKTGVKMVYEKEIKQEKETERAGGEGRERLKIQKLEEMFKSRRFQWKSPQRPERIGCSLLSTWKDNDKMPRGFAYGRSSTTGHNHITNFISSESCPTLCFVQPLFTGRTHHMARFFLYSTILKVVFLVYFISIWFCSFCSLDPRDQPLSYNWVIWTLLGWHVSKFTLKNFFFCCL